MASFNFSNSAHLSGHHYYQYLQSLSSSPPLVSCACVEIHLTLRVPVIDKWTSEAYQQWSTNGPYEKLKKFFPQLLRNVCFLVMSVVLGHWLSVPFATVPRNSVSSFDGISLVLINHGLMLVVCALNHLNHWLYLAKLEDMHKSLHREGDGVRGGPSLISVYVKVSGGLLSVASTSVSLVVNSIKFREVFLIAFFSLHLTNPINFS